MVRFIVRIPGNQWWYASLTVSDVRHDTESPCYISSGFAEPLCKDEQPGGLQAERNLERNL